MCKLQSGELNTKHTFTTSNNTIIALLSCAEMVSFLIRINIFASLISFYFPIFPVECERSALKNFSPTSVFLLQNDLKTVVDLLLKFRPKNFYFEYLRSNIWIKRESITKRFPAVSWHYQVLRVLSSFPPKPTISVFSWTSKKILVDVCVGLLYRLLCRA